MVAGEMQCRLLGVSVHAFNEQGQPVIDEVAELVVTQPLPCMPPFFWGDTENQRYLGSYFDTYPPGLGRHPAGGDLPAEAGAVWRHGDWLKITPEGRAIIYGRSDATINRHGLRMGTSELYSAVEALPEVMDSMVVDLEYLGKDSYMPLFVVLREGLTLDDALRQRLSGAIRTALSPRFVPDEMFQVAEIPRTLVRQKTRAAHQEADAGPTLGKSAEQRRHGQPWLLGLVCGDGEAAFGECLTFIASLALAMTGNTRDMPSGLTLPVIRTVANRSIHGQDSLSLGRPLFIAAAAL
jgi:acetoacetyl-CoA synthetase